MNLGMNNNVTKKQSFEFEIPDWKRVRIPPVLERPASLVVDAAFAVHKEKFPLGLLINFNEVLIKTGIHRILNVPRSREEALT